MTAAPCTVPIAAAEFGVAEITVRRWIARGAPAVRVGASGRGNGTLVDVDALRRWLVERAGLGESTPDPDGPDVRDVIARGLLAAFKRGNKGESSPQWQQSNDRSGRAALILAEAYIAIVRELTGREPADDELPKEIEFLHGLAAQSMLKPHHG